jgi:hypothetical protein
MAKWNIGIVFTEDQARKVAEKLFPHDAPPAPPWGNECPPDCKVCAECKEAWEAQVQEVWAALKTLE